MFNLIASAAPAAANAANTAKPQNPIMQMVPIFLIVIVFMFFMNRSQKKQQQKRQEMIDRLVKGTPVLLASGIRGVIDEVRENEFVVEIAPNVKITVVKNGVAEVEAEAKAEEKK